MTNLMADRDWEALNTCKSFFEPTQNIGDEAFSAIIMPAVIQRLVAIFNQSLYHSLSCIMPSLRDFSPRHFQRRVGNTALCLSIRDAESGACEKVH